MTLINPDILLIMRRVRSLLKDPAYHKLYIGTHNFPSGSCRDASLILGACIKESGLGDAKLLLGENEEGKTHAWLEYQNYILDITDDQFDNNNYPSVLVEAAADFTKNYLGFRITTTMDANEAALYGYGDNDMINTIHINESKLNCHE